MRRQSTLYGSFPKNKSIALVWCAPSCLSLNRPSEMMYIINLGFRVLLFIFSTISASEQPIIDNGVSLLPDGFLIRLHGQYDSKV